jgi:hypothetical protein
MKLWNWITGYDEEAAAAASAANARLQELNRKTYGPGGRLEHLAPIVEANYQAQDAALGVQRSGTYAAFGVPNLRDHVAGNVGVDPFSTESHQAQINQAFTDELDARANSIIGSPLRVVGNVVGNVVKSAGFAVPRWLWLAAGVAVFAYFGGFTWLRKIVKRKLA